MNKRKWTMVGAASVLGLGLVSGGAFVAANAADVNDSKGESAGVAAITGKTSGAKLGISVPSAASTVSAVSAPTAASAVSVQSAQSPVSSPSPVSPVSTPSPVSSPSPVSPASPVSIASPASAD